MSGNNDIPDWKFLAILFPFVVAFLVFCILIVRM